MQRVRPRDALTRRQLQILFLASLGMSNAEIGNKLFLSKDTVKTHLRRAFKTLGARDRTHAVALCFRSGVFPVRERAA